MEHEFGHQYGCDDGTSFAAPQVAGIAALLWSLNPNFTKVNIESFIATTVQKVGGYSYSQNKTYGTWNDQMGYGRVNAHDAVLKGLDNLGARKSISTLATAHNGGRKMVKNGSTYYLVYESGNQINYTKSTDNGSTWSDPPTRLSDGLGVNRYPCIAERSNILYVVWQRNTGTNTYDIQFRYFNDTSWQSIQSITTGVSVTSDPLPVITTRTPSESFEMMVAYRTGNGLKSRRSTSTSGSSWESELTMTSTTSAGNPNLTCRSGDLFQTSWDDGSHVLYQIFYDPYWSGLTNVSSGQGSSANTHQYPSFVDNGNRHIVWEATDPSQGNRRVVFHNFNLNLTVFTKFYSSSVNYLRPSISGIQSGAALLFWHDQSSAKNIRYARHNGTSWETSSAGIVYGTNGVDASAAIMNPPSSPIKAVWRSAGSSPYTLSLGSALSKSTELETIVYSRQLIYARDDESVLAVRLFAPQITGENKVLEFPAVANDDSLVAESLAEKLTFDFVVPATAVEATLEAEIYAYDASNLLQSGAPSLQIGFELIEVVKNRRVGFVTMDNVALHGEAKSAQSFSLPLNTLRGVAVRIRPMLSGLDLGKVRGALVHEYGAYPVESRQSKPPTAQIETNSYDLAMRIHPNPFNPSTQIRFTNPAAGAVSLRIFDVNGRLVRELLEAQRAAGEHIVTWDGRDERGTAAASGVYFIRFEAGNEVKIGKIMLVR